MRFSLLVGLLLAVGFLASCHKQRGFEEATVRNAGAEEEGGCGWFLEAGADEFKAADLPNTFLEDGRKVWIKYDRLLANTRCGTDPLRFENISLEEIKDR